MITCNLLGSDGLQSKGVEKKVFLIEPTFFANQALASDKGMIDAKFEIVNETLDTVKILDVNPHCSCTGYEISKEVLAPTDTSRLKLSVSYDQLKILKGTYSTIKIDHKIKYLIARIKLEE